jgi:hypothetical protein
MAMKNVLSVEIQRFKDRVTMLSDKLLVLLGKFYKEYILKTIFFKGNIGAYTCCSLRPYLEILVRKLTLASSPPCIGSFATHPTFSELLHINFILQ